MKPLSEALNSIRNTAQPETQNQNTSSTQLHGSMVATGTMSIPNTQTTEVTLSKQAIQTATELCPRFLTHDLEMNCYDSEYKLIELPAFKTQPRHIKDDENKAGKVDLLKAAITRLQASIAPAEPAQIKGHLGRLVLHKGIGSYEPNHWSILINDYIKFVGKYPADLIEKACDDCICDPEMEFMPKVGRLVSKMENEYKIRCMFLARMRKILSLSGENE